MSEFRKRLFTIIYGTHTPAGKGFDVVLLWFILISVLTVMLESVPSLKRQYNEWFFRLEWFFTIAFTIEYLTRIYSHPKPLKYIFSFYGIIDLISILPTYLALLLGGLQYLVTIRALRLLRIFRILKLTSFIHNAQLIKLAMLASYQKIMVFMLTVLSIVLIIGTMMYVIEGDKGGFTSIPISIYWCIVTITTVGYGDITPLTPVGKLLSAFVMLIGYSIIAVPTGIVTVELSKAMSGPGTAEPHTESLCTNCGEIMPAAANFCMNCGAIMEQH
jgi:voltage-gated potassium channel